MFDNLAHRFLNNIFEPKPTVHTVPKKFFFFKFAIKSPDFAMLLIHILTFDLSFASLHKFLLSFLLRVRTLMRCGVVYLFKFRVICGSNHAPFTHQSIRTLGNLSYKRKTIIQSSHVQHFLPLKLYRSLCQL